MFICSLSQINVSFSLEPLRVYFGNSWDKIRACTPHSYAGMHRRVAWMYMVENFLLEDVLNAVCPALSKICFISLLRAVLPRTESVYGVRRWREINGLV